MSNELARATFEALGMGGLIPPITLLYLFTGNNLAESRLKVSGEVNMQNVSLSIPNPGSRMQLAMWWVDHRSDEHPGDIDNGVRVYRDIVWPALALTLLILENPGGAFRGKMSAADMEKFAAKTNRKLYNEVRETDPVLQANLELIFLRSTIGVELGRETVFQRENQLVVTRSGEA